MSIKAKYSLTNKIVQIGPQIWMADNLDVDHFRNGDPIPQTKSNEEWVKALTDEKPAWCYFENDSANGRTNYKLYNWYAVNDDRGLAPEGWHIPGDHEWELLKDNLGENWQQKLKFGEFPVQDKFTESEKLSSGFNCLPNVYRTPDDGFKSLGEDAVWWSIFPEKHYEDYIDEDSGEVFSLEVIKYVGQVVSTGSDIDKSYDRITIGMSVRCVMDALDTLLVKYGVSQSAELTSITMEDVQSLTGHYNELNLSGLTFLPDDVAQALSKNEAWELRLDGITTLTDASAKALGKHKGGRIYLSGLLYLTDFAAGELSQFEGADLYLNGLKALSETGAEALSRFKGGRLHLSGLTDLSTAAAQKLSQFQGEELFLNGLTQLTDEMAQALSQFKVKHLWLTGLTNLSDASAQVLSTRKYLWFNEAITLSDTGKEVLAKQIKANSNRRLKEDFLRRVTNNYKEFNYDHEVEICFHGSGDEFGSFNEVLVTDWQGQRLYGSWDLSEDDESLLFKIIDASGCNYNYNNYGTEGKIKYSDGKLSVETVIGYEDFGDVEWEEEENG